MKIFSRSELFSIAITALFLFAFLGFLGVSADNTQYLLGAYERVNPGFLVQDWFVQDTESFHPFFEIYMAWWLKYDLLTPGLFLWYALNLLWLSAIILILIKYLGLGKRLPRAMMLATVLLLVGVRQGWGQYEILTGQALPAYLAYPPALMSVVLLFQRRFFMSAFALTLTFLIHHGLGALLLLCLMGPCRWHWDNDPRGGAKGTVKVIHRLNFPSGLLITLMEGEGCITWICMPKLEGFVL